MSFTIRYLIFLWVLIQFSPALSQSKRGNIAVFGNSRALSLNFNSEPPLFAPLPRPHFFDFSTDEGSASISDWDGNLLFYTNGATVWNREYDIMQNGFDPLMKFFSATTTQVIIVPFPKDPFQYYIFGAGYQGGPLHYAVVDMRYDRGLGAVVSKGNLLDMKSTEKLCVVEHETDDALWLITHEYGSSKFKVFYIDENGINDSPVISDIGFEHSTEVKYESGYSVEGTNAIGYLKASHDGKWLACAIDGTVRSLELFDFDRATGAVSNQNVLMDRGSDSCYGVEFSPDDSKLYLSTVDGNLFQFNLDVDTPDEISADKILIATTDTGGALQIGPDGRIYRVGKIYAKYLDVIENPNELGAQCDFQREKIDLLDNPVWMGLPEMVYRAIDPEIMYSKFCKNDSTQFELVKIKDYESVKWDFGDPLTGENNYSNERRPVHRFTQAGEYKVQIEVSFQDGSIFNYSQKIKIFDLPAIDLGPDKAKCISQSVVLESLRDNADVSYLWSTGSSNSSVNASSAGSYWLQITNLICSASDTILVVDIPPPNLVLTDTMVCHYQDLLIELDDSFEYLWSDGSSASMRWIGEPGLYQVQATNMCGSDEGSFNFSFIPKLHLSLPPDTVLCTGGKLLLDVSQSVSSYQWQDGTKDPLYVIDRPGSYSVNLFNRCESIDGYINVDIVQRDELFIPNVLTANDDDLNGRFILDAALIRPSLDIYDRWGNSIFSSLNYDDSWTAAGVPTGVYFYIIRDDCADVTLKGPLTILR